MYRTTAAKCNSIPRRKLPLMRERFLRIDYSEYISSHQLSNSQAKIAIATLCCFLALTAPWVGSYTFRYPSSRDYASFRNDATREQASFNSRILNICVLHDRRDENSDEIVASSTPIDNSKTSSQYVQQEQLLEVVSRSGADKISSLSISERTKRAMLAEAVEDEIFACTEQIIDLVKEQQSDHSDESNPPDKQNKNANEKLNELKERNQSLQMQYNDLVSGRRSSLLNMVSVVDSLKKNIYDDSIDSASSYH